LPFAFREPPGRYRINSDEETLRHPALSVKQIKYRSAKKAMESREN